MLIQVHHNTDKLIVTTLPAVLKAQLHWLHNKISSSPPAMSRRLPHSGQNVREPIMLSGPWVDIVYKNNEEELVKCAFLDGIQKKK